MKLGKRLTQIESMVEGGYDHIWDCCCDHGLLGAALLNRQAAANIHFVDIVADIMAQVTSKLERFYPQESQTAASQWHVHCVDVALLPLQQFNGKHLLILAGVGGELMIDFITAIHTQHPNADIDFLLCPVHHQFLVRQTLISLDYRLYTEILLEENKRVYEIMLVARAQQASVVLQPIHPVGSLLWQVHTSEQEKNAIGYLDKTLNHYRRIQLNNTTQVQHIIEAYSSVAVTFDHQTTC